MQLHELSEGQKDGERLKGWRAALPRLAGLTSGPLVVSIELNILMATDIFCTALLASLLLLSCLFC
eukprot:1161708-Pelagomonas_calceolata.AAC.2